MYCTKCGKEIADTDNVCKFCGVPVEKVSDESVVNNNESEVVEVNEPEITVPVDNNESEVLEAVDLTQEAPKPAKSRMSKKKKFTILGICAAFVIAVALSVVLFWDYVENTAVSTFSSSEKYYHYVEEKNVEKTAESIGSVIGNFSEVFADNAVNGGKSEISIQLGDVLLDALAKNLSVEKSQISWASDIDLKGVSSVKNGVSAGKTELSLNNKPILNIEIVFKMEDMSYYLRVPELNKDYMLFKMPEVQDSDINTETLMNIYKAFPDEQLTTDIISRYLTVAIRNIDDVKKQKVSVTANGVEQNCTELTVNIDEEVVADVVEAILKEFRNDKEIKDVIKKFYQAVDPNSADNFDKKYSELIAEVDKTLDDIEELEDDLGNIDFTIVTWVDSKGEAIGREIKSTEFDGKIRYLSTHDGTKVGIEAYFFADDGEGIELLGNGNIKASKMSGNLELFAVGINGDAKLSIANISIKDYDVDLIEDNYLNGVFTITLSDAMCDELAKQTDMPNEVVDYLKKGSVEISITSSEGKGNVKLTVLYDSKTVIAISFSTAKNKPSDVTVPEKAVNINDEDKLLEYVGNMKFDTLKENLKAAGVPSDLVDSVFDMLNGGGMTQEPQLNDSYNDNWDYGGDLDYSGEMF